MTMQCEVIRDLLPLYQDELCSPVTAELVRQHLAECPDCARAAERMRSQVHVEERPVIRAESPFYVYQKKVFLRTVLAVLATLAVCFAAFCGWQYFAENYPPRQIVLSRVTAQATDQWRQVEEPVVFDSIFHRREVILDADCERPADLRFRDENGDLALEVTALPGQAVSLEELERDRPYTVEMRGEPDIFLQFR